MSVLNKFKNMFKDKPAEGSSKSAAQGSSSTPVQGKTSSTQGGKAQPHIWAVSTETKQNLAKGVKFNMKVVIKGMRRTGKSSLMRLLNGLGPDATTEYVPTPQIAASTIYLPSSTDPSEGAKVEIWEVVDEAAQSRPANSADRVRAHDGAVAVDASVLDVYKGSHAAIFMVDGTRRETFDYAKREAALVPPQCSILICLNFYDKDEHFRVVSDHDVDDFCQSLNGACTPLLLQAAGGNPSSIPRELSVAASWMPCSMTTGMGFSAIQAFLEIPFALVQLDSLEKQMRTLYRAVDSVRANMLQERAELRFQLRHGTSPLEAPQPKSPNPGLAAKASNAIPIATQAAVSLASSLPKSPHVAQAIKAVVPIAAAAVLKPQPKSASSTSAAPVPAKAAPKTGAAPPATDDPKKVLDNFFDDDNEYDDEDEQPESDSDHHAPTPPPAPRRSMVTAQPAKAPVQVVPPTAAPVAPLPKPAAPAAQENAKEAPTTTVEAKSNPPAPATPPVAQQEQPAASPEVESVAATKHQEFVDVSSLGKSEVVQGFFGDDDDDADEKGDNEVEEGPGAVATQPQAATSRDPPTTTADPTTAVVPEPAKQDSAAAARKAPRKLGAAKDDGSSEEDVKPSAVKGTRRPVGATRQPAPVVIAPPVAAAVVPPSVDLNALLSQFSSALQTTPKEAASADPEEGGDTEKKSKNDKKDKSAKKEKKDKKDKSSKKSEGDLNPPADDGDDIVVVRGSDD